MTGAPRALAGVSVAALVVAVVVALVLGPEHGRFWLVISGGLAVVLSVQSVLSEPGDLGLALFLALVPVLALTAEGAPTGLAGPLGVLLYVSGELNSLSWACRGPSGVTEVQRRRLRAVGPVALLALVAGLAVYVAPAVPPFLGTVAVGAAALALVALGLVLFRGTRPPAPPSEG